MVQQIQWETVSDLFFNLFSKSELVPSVYLGHFFCLGVSYLKEWSLRCLLGWGNAGCWTVTLYVGEGPRGSNGACSTLHWVSATPSASHNQIGPLWCGFPSRWACAHPRPLWVSPRTSPVRLGVSPAATPTPTGIFNQRFEALFPRAGALGYADCFASLRLSWFICVQVWGRGVLPALCLPCSLPLWVWPSRFICVQTWGHRVCQWSDCPPSLSHTPPVSVRHSNSSPLRPRCPSPPLLPVWMNVYPWSTWCRTSLPLDFPSVLVVRGNTVCLPMPPSWFSSSVLMFLNWHIKSG